VPLIRLQGADDPRAAGSWQLKDVELLRRQNGFVAEGRLVVQRVIEDRRFRVRSLLLSESAAAALQPWIQRLPPEVPVLVCDLGDFPGITGFNIHRGCLALVERPRARDPIQLLGASQTIVALDGVANADNVGSVFRNAAAFAVDAVLLGPGCCDPLYRKAVRTSMGAVLQVPFASVAEWTDLQAPIASAGFTVVALTARQPSVALDQFARARTWRRLMMLVGAEGRGLSAGAEHLAGHHVRIPIAAGVDSLNLAVASGIALARLMSAGDVSA
jgi:tRNA G18 (ribose-2'-O)-methylase SpoU